ncbi:PLxRFG domain-containing protein [Ciceribacter sp. L1K22]|uniref:PLxRFG domain-containing protein n=1 Tax=Ciceribacter sp. L1K22 TaxID=2820275 RepID=UPI001ABE6EFA|nr:PLxRFG domain-containing protein [Ciceribacter sp. L1K22]MBO3760354.1 PLxRFG domain-containing protein [Ciceribacter sp. L1K22]
MPIVLGLGQSEWKDPLNLFGTQPGIAPPKPDTTATTRTQTPAVDTAKPSQPQSRPSFKLDETDRNDLINTIIAEAAGEGEAGMAGVAAVILNRSQRRGKSPGEIVREPNQFSGYAKPGPGALKAMQDPAMRDTAGQILDAVLAGQIPDPTGGADHFKTSAVSPGWADQMTKTTSIGAHEFYDSGRRPKTKDMPTFDEAVASSTASTSSAEPFDAVLAGDKKPSGGLQALVKEPDVAPGSVGSLTFVHKGQEKIDPSFRGILETVSTDLGQGLIVTSGYRSPSHPVEARKKTPGEHARGTAIDIDMRGMSEEQRAGLVASLMARGVRRFGTYSGSPNMLHVDMKDQTGAGTPWFMHDRSNRNIEKAPSWFRAIAANPGSVSTATAFAPGQKAPGPIKSPAIEENPARPTAGAIILDRNFTPANGLGLFQGENPFQIAAQKNVETQNAAINAQSEANRMRGFSQNSVPQDPAQMPPDPSLDLVAENPERFEVIDESQLGDWQEQWEKDNRSGGLGGDVWRILKSGTVAVGQSLSSIADTLFRKIPGGERFLQASDEIDRWAMGETAYQAMDTARTRANASVTERQQEADVKNWWDEENGWFGPAWRDPRSYVRVVGESAPGTIVTMAPGGILARGAYLRALAGGATQKAAAATAARTATLSGALLEGGLGAGDSAKNVRDRIDAIPHEQLAQSEAVIALVEGGMTEDEAIAAIREDAATQAFVVSGVATGMLGGIGDRTLANIIGEGIGGGIARRVASGVARGVIAEGVIEEGGQGAAQTISENAAVRRADPNQSLTEGLGENVAAGIAGGGAMGGAMGGAAGAARPATTQALPDDGMSTAPEPDDEPIAGPPTRPEPAGPIGRAVRHAEDQIATRNAGVVPAPVVADGRPEIGATVQVDAEGMDPFMARVDGYDGDEAILIDGGSGEVYQVPIANIKQIAKSPETLARENPRPTGPVPIDDEIPDFSTDPALEPAPPVAGEVTSEGLLPAKEQKPATERFPGAPRPGESVIVDDDNGNRFAAKVQRYENDGTEAVVVDAEGKTFQVPVNALKVSKLTDKQVEQQELKRNPPVEREDPEMTPTRRKIGERVVEMPDDRHARLFDLGRERFLSKRTLGASTLDIDAVDNPSLRKLADEYGVSTTALGAMADDYRYRAERAAKEAKSKLPVKLPPVNERRLGQWQAERRKAEGRETPEADDLANWWDVQLTAPERKRILGEAGVKRSERAMWGGFTPAIRNKLEAVRNGAAGNVPAPAPTTVDEAANIAATSPTNDLPEPTQAQKEAGNYKVGRVRLGGLDLSIENPEGSERKGTDAKGKAWSIRMKSHYGYIRGTVGRDKDHIDAFIKPGTETLPDTAPVFVVDQRAGNGRFDEHKIMLGYDAIESARAAYMENYTKGWKGLGAITQTTLADFKAWLRSGKTTEPFAQQATTPPADPFATAPWDDVWGSDADAVSDALSRIVSMTGRNDQVITDAVRAKATDAELLKIAADVMGVGAAPGQTSASGRRYDVEARPGPRVIITLMKDEGPKRIELKGKNLADALRREYVESLDEMRAAAAAREAAQAEQKPAKPTVSANTIFTDDAAEKARALLRRKLSGNTLNSGIDPELLQAGITLAGYHIEKGARTFAAYAAAMITDLGESARPYLKSWYMGVKYDPRAAQFDGMSTAAEVEAFDVEAIQGGPDEPAELGRAGAEPLARAPAAAVQRTETGRDAGAGPERRGGADVSRGGRAGTERRQPGRRVADDARDVPPAARRERDDGTGELFGQPRGDESRGSGTKDDAGEIGAFGPILRGFEGRWRDAALELERRQTGDAIAALSHRDIGAIDLVWGHAGTNQHNGAGLAKLIAWHPEVLQDLQWFLDRLHVDEARRTARRVQLVDATGRAGVRLDFDGASKTWLLTAFESTAPRRKEANTKSLSEVWESGGSGATSDTTALEPSDANASLGTATTVKISDQLKNVQSQAVPAQQLPTDYVITEQDELGQAGEKKKFNANVAAIRVLRTLDAEKRPATRDEQSVLAKWVGWGGLRSAFYREDGSVAKGWEKQAAELKALLTAEEYRAAESSTRNAHYTSPEIVAAVWDIVDRLGFKGGQILEPSVGAGNFLGMMPGPIRDGSKVTGVELDHITGSIAKNLYPKANIQAPIGFEKITLPNDYFDLVVGNPPFGSERVYDKDRRHLNKLSIHNFFFAKSIETLRPGGVAVMIVTNRFLDGQSAAARNLIHKQADLVGAIRLPNDAFLKNAGTEVTTDIIVLRKRMPGDTPASSDWLEVQDYGGRDGTPVPLNRYFVANPDMMLGEFGAFGTMYGPDEPALIARGGQDTPAELRRATESMPSGIAAQTTLDVVEQIAVPETVTDVQIGSMFLAPDGTIHQRTADSIGQPQSKPIEFQNETSRDRVTGMVRVRDAFARLRRAQIDDAATDAKVENLRGRLNAVYDAFVKKHGPINSDANKRLFRDDPTWPQIAALENNFDKGISAAVAKTTGEKARPATADKAPIFSKRTQQPYRRPDRATSAKDALATVLNDKGRVDLDAMAALYGKSQDEIVAELGPLLFRTPAGSYETADGYLSGNVKQKLAEAERAAEQDTQFRRNVSALRDVIPADIDAVDIDVKPGAPWVPPNHVEDFILHIAQAKTGARATYSNGNARWELVVPQGSAAAGTLWATDRASLSSVLTSVLNGQTITVYDRRWDGNSVLNQPATDAANEKAERVKTEWRRWLWDDDARRVELARLYNDTFNTTVQRVYDGSHLSLPGKVGDDIIAFRPHQKNFVWRTLQSGTALADHTVGAGKTFAAIASVMEKRRIGQARKPMMVVPNHLVGQWAADFIKLYPGAKVLAATKKDFEKENRKRFFARIATGDWDAVIVAHSSFGRIGMNPEFEVKFIQEQMDDLEASITQLRQKTGEHSRNIAQLSKWRDNLKSKMERLLDSGKKDDGLTFDELGVDALYFDEMHEFKNLAFATGMTRVAGLGNPAGSQKAADAYMKIQFVLQRTGGNNVVGLTGTPLSNTMAEMYTVQRYLAGDTLKKLGIAHFDAWAKVFGEVVTDWELSPSGQYKLNSRFAKFVNLPELMQSYLSFADVITNDDIKAQLAAIGKTLPLPKVKGGKPTNITVERSRDQASFIGEGRADADGNLTFPKGSLVWRAENLPKKVEKGADNMLKVMSDARKAALDMRLIDASYADDPASKVHRAADEMVRLYRAWDEKKGTQLVFIDLSTPKKAKAREEAALRALIKQADEGNEAAQEKLDAMSPDEFLALQSPFSVYDDLREKLVQRGIPPEEIAFIHDANTEAQKEELFGKVRSGRVRFLFGSTAKMGAGTNVQNRLVALHHLDAPWRPSDLEQRDGRGIRQGNELYLDDPVGFEIEILRYATKNTLDARQWQTIEAKARFIQQVRKGNVKTREIEDIAGEAANAAEMKAAASGNPLILEEMETRRKLRQLEQQSVEHDREQHRIKARIRSLTDEVEAIEARSKAVAADAAAAAKATDAPLSITFDGASFDKPKEFGAAVIAAIRKEIISNTGRTPEGRFADFAITTEIEDARSFSLFITGEREYVVYVPDAADVDPTGLAMRVLNTVRKLTTYPEIDQERVVEARAQIPELEKQIGPWSNEQELSDTAARHKRLLDLLKPKRAGQSATAAATKRPDPVVTNVDGKMKSLPLPERAEGETMFAWAKRHLLDRGRNTGHEFLFAIDDDGTVVEYGTGGEPRSTGMNAKLAGALENPDRRLVVLHNHPSNSPVSLQDISFLGYPGLYAAWAIGHGGRNTRIELTAAAKAKLSASGRTPEQAVALFKQQLLEARTGPQNHLRQLFNARALTLEAANAADASIAATIAERAGIIDFSDNQRYDPASVPGLDDVLNAAASTLARKFFDDRNAKIRQQGADRSAEPLRHIGELEGMGTGGQQMAPVGPGSTGLSEGGARGYPREGGRRVTQRRIASELNGKLTDLQPALLKAVPLNYFTELAQPNMTAVADYLRVKRLMDAFRGQMHARSDEVAGEWLKYMRLGFAGKDKAKAQQLADLMHDATLAGVDPAATDEETTAKPGYQALRKRYMAMPPKGRELYQKVRDAYFEQQLQLDEILLDNVRKAQEIALARADERYKRTMQRIRDARLTGPELRRAEEDALSAHKAETTKAKWAAKARMTKMRIAFESSRVEKPYFPLGRFGRYFVTVRDVDGSVLSFSKFERAAERDRFAEEMRGSYPAAKVEAGVMEQGSDLRKAMDPRIVAEIEEILGGAGVDHAVMDMIWQRYLEAMPDLSARKRFIHRKGTAGYSGDALRVFSSHMFHASHQMARLKYGLELQELVDQSIDQAKEAKDQTKAMTLANELSKRHDWVMNPTGSSVAQTMTSAAFVWYLASSPAAAAVNMTQTVMLGLPILGARFGSTAKAAAAIAKASIDSISGRGTVTRASLSKDERAAMNAFYDSGLIDRTQSHDLAGVGDTGVNYSPLKARVMAVISWAFHRAEVWNREVTALAAYRMAREKGQTMSEAIDTAHDLTWKTHFDYSNSSRPAVMQNDFAKVALVFRQHNINMLYRVARDVHQSVAGMSPQARREARYQLAGVVGMMSLMAGVTGTIGFNLLMSVLGMVFGDDDDPLEFNERFRADVLDILGPELGGVVLNGVPGHYLGIDLSSRIGMPDLWFRSPTRELQGKDEYQYWLSQGLGATVSLGESLFVGAKTVMEGDTARGIEMMAPKAVRDIMKAYRYSDEGLTTLKGEEMVSPDEIGWHGVVAQSIGFMPAVVAETWDRNTALKNAETRILDERQRVINKWAMAVLAKEDSSQALAAIKAFNARPYSIGVKITRETLERSIKTRARNRAKREEGVLIQNPALGKALRDQLPEAIYR